MIAKRAPYQFLLAEVGGICSLIFLPYATGITSVEDAKEVVRQACKTDRGFGQYVFTSFHPKDMPNMIQILTDAGWSKIAEYPSGHPNFEDYHMEMWGILTGQWPR